MCVLAARSPRDADAMASVLQVVGAIERIGNAAVDISPHRHPPPRHPPGAGRRPVRGRGGLPPGARAGGLAHGPPLAVRPRAAHRGRACGWSPSGATASGSPTSTATRSCCRATCCSCRARRPASPSCARWPARPRASRRRLPEDAAVTDLDRAIDVLVEMKNISEVAVGLAYSALGAARPRAGRRGQPPRGPARRDEGAPRGLGAARRPRPDRPLAAAGPAAPGAGGRGDRRRRPADGVAGRAGRGAPPDPGPRAGRRRRGGRAGAGGRGVAADGQTPGELPLETETGFYLLAIRRGGRYFYRPRRESCSRPATSSSPPAPTRATPCWPSCAEQRWQRRLTRPFPARTGHEVLAGHRPF